MERYYLTQEGLARLKQEYAYLRTTGWAEVVRKRRAAAEDGKLCENAAYDAAMEEQGILADRINDLNNILANAKLIDEAPATSRVRIGSIVTVVDVEDEEECYFIVGPLEAAPREGRISNVSPIGMALIGRGVGDEVQVWTPAGTYRLRITGIS